MKTTFPPVSNGAIYRTCLNEIESNAEKLVFETEKIEKDISEWCKLTFLDKNDHLLVVRQRYNGRPSKSLPIGEPKNYVINNNNKEDFWNKVLTF